MLRTKSWLSEIVKGKIIVVVFLKKLMYNWHIKWSSVCTLYWFHIWIPYFNHMIHTSYIWVSRWVVDGPFLNWSLLSLLFLFLCITKSTQNMDISSWGLYFSIFGFIFLNLLVEIQGGISHTLSLNYQKM